MTLKLLLPVIIAVMSFGLINSAYADDKSVDDIFNQMHQELFDLKNMYDNSESPEEKERIKISYDNLFAEIRDTREFRKSLDDLNEYPLFLLWDEIDLGNKSKNQQELRKTIIDEKIDKIQSSNKIDFSPDQPEADNKDKIQNLKDKIKKVDQKIKRLFAKDTTGFSNEERINHEKKYRNANDRLDRLNGILETLQENKNYPNQQPIVQPDEDNVDVPLDMENPQQRGVRK